MRPHKEKTAHEPGGEPLTAPHRSGKSSRPALGCSSRPTGRGGTRRRTRLWLPYLALALLPIPAWGQQAPASPRRDVAEMSLEDNRVRFEVGVTAAQEAGLQVSSGREH